MPNPQYVTLTANTPQAVDVTTYVGSMGAVVKVTTDGNNTSPVYFTTDGTTAAVAAGNAQVVLAGGANYETMPVTRSHNATTGVDGSASVSLISAGSAWAKVEVVQP